MRILVCGGRDCTNKAFVWGGIGQFIEEHGFLARVMGVTIISGAAKGVDTLAAEYARLKGYALEEFPADWAFHGRKAGYIRNKEMLDVGQPDFVLAFPGGKGTTMMVDMAIKADIRVTEVELDPTGCIVMGTKGSGSATGDFDIKTQMYQQKYISIVSAVPSLSIMERCQIYRDIVLEERNWLQGQEMASAEYEDILKAQEVMENFNDKHDSTQVDPSPPASEAD